MATCVDLVAELENANIQHRIFWKVVK